LLRRPARLGQGRSVRRISHKGCREKQRENHSASSSSYENTKRRLAHAPKWYGASVEMARPLRGCHQRLQRATVSSMTSTEDHVATRTLARYRITTPARDAEIVRTWMLTKARLPSSSRLGHQYGFDLIAEPTQRRFIDDERRRQTQRVVVRIFAENAAPGQRFA